jgi:hypothetical protein
MTDPLESTPDDEPIATRQAPRVTGEERVAMAIQHELGVSSTDLARHFGYNPRTVRTAIRAVSDEERRWISTIAHQELLGLHVGLARKAIAALLARDLNRERVGKDGKPIPGSYVVSEVQLGTVAGISTSWCRRSSLAPWQASRPTS